MLTSVIPPAMLCALFSDTPGNAGFSLRVGYFAASAAPMPYDATSPQSARPRRPPPASRCSSGPSPCTSAPYPANPAFISRELGMPCAASLLIVCFVEL